LVVRKVITLLAEGVRDGAAARAASDSLFTERGGKVSATLNILSVDQQTNTLVITRNNPAPAILSIQENVKWLDEPSIPIGLYRDTRPVINEIPLQPGIMAVAYTDGLVHAGERTGQGMDTIAWLEDLLEDESPSPQYVADALLEQALRLDQYRPSDDISVVVLSIQKRSGDDVRRMTVRIPLGSH
jgi:serine phosphatase RsbU (regulator of sigma subunit)